MMVRYCEGWLAHLLTQQPWVQQVGTFTAAGGDPKPVGLTITPAGGRAVRVQLVRGAPTTAAAGGGGCPDTWEGDQAGAVPVVDAHPANPVQLCEAVAAVVTATNHPDVTVCQTYAEWGRSTKPAGWRIAYRDGAEVFASVL